MNYNDASFHQQSSKACRICNGFYEDVPCAAAITKKVYDNCTKYLHSAIIERNFTETCNFSEETESPVICRQCFEPALRLSQLNDQLETLHKSVNDLLLTFSLAVLHRRTKVNNDLHNQIKIEIDIGTIPGVLPNSPQEGIIGGHDDEIDPLLIPNIVLEENIGEGDIFVKMEQPSPTMDTRPQHSSCVSQNIKQERTAHAEKPHKCPFCSMRFSVKHSLNRHTRTHTGEKPFACQYCPMKFAIAYNRNLHMRTHTRDQPFSCPHCDKRFACSTSRTRHLKNIHSNQT